MVEKVNGVGYASGEDAPISRNSHDRPSSPYMTIYAPVPRFPTPEFIAISWAFADPNEVSISTRHSVASSHHHTGLSIRSDKPPLKHESYRPHKSHVHRATAHAVSTAQSHHVQPSVQFSKCTGRRKALCVGINYHGQKRELRGCVNDAKNVYRFLHRYHNYKPENVILLSDDTSDPRRLPTRANIIAAMKWLVKGAQPHDSLFFHYSGHGGRARDLDGDEKDGYDEVIYPLDHDKAGYITDDLMHDIMVQSLPAGCRLTALFDACHSGSMLDLPYLYHSNGRVKGSQVADRFFRQKASFADVISWGGCKDSQTSADTWEDGAATGAMSFAFMSSLRRNPNQSYAELLRSVREILRKKYSQKPQLSSSHRIDTSLKFII